MKPVTWQVLITLVGVMAPSIRDVSSSPNYSAPRISLEPSPKVAFLNSTGTSLHCSATGNPAPDIYWVLTDGSRVTDLPGLRISLPNGTLMFLPFRSDTYRQDVHSTIYRCVASNLLGKVGSRSIGVRAVVLQDYEVQVYDEFVTKGNTAVLRCYVPSYIRDYVIVTTWERDDGVTIVSNVANGGRYSVLSHGELHIRDTTNEDGFKRYYCRTSHTLSGQSQLSKNSGRLIITDTETNQVPRLSETRTIYRVQQGTPVELTCAAQAYPIPTYSWYRKDGTNLIAVTTSVNIIQISGSLYIRKTSVRDGGTYVCLVKNRIGQKRMETHLTVTAPLLAKLAPEKLLVSAGRSATLTCNVSGFPVDTVRWVKDQRSLEPDGFKFQLLTRDSLHVSSIGREDRGVYQCYVNNKADSAQASLEIVLKETAPIFLDTFTNQIMKPGPTVSLRCEASGTPLPQVMWSLDGYSIPDNDRVRVGDYVSRDGNVISFVNITNIQVEDGGAYECIAKNHVGETHHFSRLNVVGDPVVKYMPTKVIVSGESGVLHCRIAGFPIKHISWEKDGRQLPVNRRQEVFSNGSLVIRDVQKTKDDGVYTCTASNELGTSASGEVHVQVRVKPIVFPFAFPENVERGMKFSMVCSVAAGDPPIEISWFKDGVLLSSKDDITVKTVSENSLLLAIDNVGLQHRGDYTCVAKNDGGAVNHTSPLTVYVPPSWRIEPHDASVVVGQSVTLDCQSEGYPPPRIRWEKAQGATPSNYHPISTNYHQQIFENGSLTIQDVTKQDGGYYLCQATNGIGSEISGVITLKVHAAPQFHTRFRTQMVQIGESVSLECSVSGDQPIKTTWSRDKQLITLENEPRIRKNEATSGDTLKSEVTVSSVGRDDSALYTCKASNDYGSDESNIQLIVQEPPDPPKRIRIVETTSRSVQLEWDPPFGGNSPITSYHIFWQSTRVSEGENYRPIHNATVPSSDVTSRVENLKPATSYELFIAAENVIGVSKFSNKVSVTTEAETPAGPPTSITVESVTSEALRVSWLPPPESVRNGMIQGYYVGYKHTNSSEKYQYKTVEAGPTETAGLHRELKGLRKYTFYSVVVQAFNEKGAGPRSDPVTGRTLEDVPALPPGNLRCAPLTSQSITVTWTHPPQSSINGILKGYKVVYRPGKLLYGPVSSFVAESDETEAVLQGLMKFTNYSFLVSAFTRRGDGVTSDPVYCRTLPDVPSAPADIKALPMLSNAILVSWKLPLYPNGIIEQYTLYKRWSSGGRQDTTLHRVAPSRRHFEALNLEENKRYEFWVTASTSVGEGKSTRVLSQRTSETIPARIASFSEHVTVTRGTKVQFPCLAVGISSPHRQWAFRGQPIMERRNTVHVLTNGSLELSSAEEGDSGNYTCRARNEHGADEIVFVLNVQVQYIPGKDFPAPRDLSVTMVTSSSVQISWNIDQRFKLGLTGYTVRFKRDFGQWQKKTIPASKTTCTMDNLSCGTKYHIQVAAVGVEGEGDPSDILTVRTKGGVPVAPSIGTFVSSNSTSISLQMNGWESGGCPVNSYIVRYKRLFSNDWKTITTDLKRLRNHVVIQGLSQGTWYKLRVTAHNSAGSTVKEYDVSTLTVDGATIGPLAVGGYHRPGKPWEELNIIIPIVAAAVALTVVLGVAICVCFKRRQPDDLYDQNRQSPEGLAVKHRTGQKKLTEDVQYQEVPTYHQRALKVQRPLRNDASLDRNQALSPPEDHCVGYEDDLTPYATCRLPGCDSDTESSQGTVRELQTFTNQYHRPIPDPSAQETTQHWGELVVNLQQNRAKLPIYEWKLPNTIVRPYCDVFYNVDSRDVSTKECIEPIVTTTGSLFTDCDHETKFI